MNRILFIITFLVCSVIGFGQTNDSTTVGGGGFCYTEVHPDSLPQLQEQSLRECKYVFDTLKNITYHYRGDSTLGKRWYQAFYNTEEVDSLLTVVGDNIDTLFVDPDFGSPGESVMRITYMDGSQDTFEINEVFESGKITSINYINDSTLQFVQYSGNNSIGASLNLAGFEYVIKKYSTEKSDSVFEDVDSTLAEIICEYDPNSTPILNEHYRTIGDNGKIEEVNNAAQEISCLLNTTLSSGRNAFQDAKLVWVADNEDTLLTRSQKGVDLTFARPSIATEINNEGLIDSSLTNWPRVEFSEDQQRGGLLLEQARSFYAINTQPSTNLIAVTVTDTVIGIDNNLSGYEYTDNDGANIGEVRYDVIPPDSAVFYTSVIYIKKDNNTDRFIQIWQRHFTGGFTNSNSINLNTSTGDIYEQNINGTYEVSEFNDWWKITSKLYNQSDIVRIYIRPAISNNVIDQVEVSATGSVKVGGVLLYKDTVSTSYMYTSSSPTTRSPDTLSATPGFGDSTGTFIVDVATDYDGEIMRLQGSDDAVLIRQNDTLKVITSGTDTTTVGAAKAEDEIAFAWSDYILSVVQRDGGAVEIAQDSTTDFQDVYSNPSAPVTMYKWLAYDFRLASSEMIDMIGRDYEFDASYDLLLAKADELNYTKPSQDQLHLQNNHMVSLKDSVIFDSLDIYYVMANDGSADFSTLNWINPDSFQLTRVNSPTWTSNQGFTGDGASSYLETNWHPVNDGVNWDDRNTTGMGVYNRTATSDGYELGTGTSATYLRNWPSNGSFRFEMQGPTIIESPDRGVGFYQVYRNNPSAVSAFVNNTTIINEQTNVNDSDTQNELYILTYSPSIVFSSDQLSVVFAGGDLSAKASAFNTIVQKYMSRL